LSRGRAPLVASHIVPHHRRRRGCCVAKAELDTASDGHAPEDS
jgi:hypothetical protein